jgi:hypothetical protein
MRQTSPEGRSVGPSIVQILQERCDCQAQSSRLIAEKSGKCPALGLRRFEPLYHFGIRLATNSGTKFNNLA